MMLISSKSKQWTDEKGYKRGILFPFGNRIDSGLQIQETIIEAGNHVPDHYHKGQTEFIYVLAGSCEFRLERDAFILNKGDLLIIEPGKVHSTTNPHATDVQLLTFKLNGSVNDSVWLKT